MGNTFSQSQGCLLFGGFTVILKIVYIIRTTIALGNCSLLSKKYACLIAAVYCGAAPNSDTTFIDAAEENGVTFGETTTYRCKPGFRFVDLETAVITCDVAENGLDGIWPEAPKCTGKLD